MMASLRMESSGMESSGMESGRMELSGMESGRMESGRMESSGIKLNGMESSRIESLRVEDLDFGIDVGQYVADRTAEARGLARDSVKMLVVHRSTGRLQDTRFSSLPDFLEAGDVLVVNSSATIPARLAVHSQGQHHFIHLAARLSANRFLIERRGGHGEADARFWPEGTAITVLGGDVNGRPAASCRVNRRFHPNSRLWEVEADEDLYQLAPSIGSPIRYDYVKQDTTAGDYRTIFARIAGSSEMPSASRPFTKPILRQLARRGVKVASITLHTSVSSHEVETDLSQHPVLPEWYQVSEQSATVINRAKANGNRIIAVGTTAVRAIESSVDASGKVMPQQGWTTHLVTPSTKPKVVTSLVTGMHDNHTSHLALMYAFILPDTLRQAYRVAADHGYLWHEFGDISLIL
ncbi:S-adenosylmethionine:tRNA ribosyltransferase-isomerase [Alicyclobacillus sp. SO9]|uniref:S-adenosylmethionine:tRNA ribosyltransferase-isomerase n=1 Tax=Alicyclobacillus sp. SO9 TaxID=2665646 RepID=UPI0018E6FAAA|nr:S-adenosylmethionine:tRNA ribosyltransferase-isomerase [Alicyclobacillus sp. SO9]QQE80572.1 S-adenosylmethionine:tRNA ribosyltransferase-isomerase [Alicyclobacillus sp. SO9]